MYCLEYKDVQANSIEKDAENNNDSVDVIAESSSSETSPCSMMPQLGDLTLEKDIERKAVKQELYDLKLRIYYMEQREKNSKYDDDNDIYQKYLDLQIEFEKLSKSVDEKDELLLKAQQVTTYLREEKEKLLFELENKEKFYQEHVQQLEKELEEMKLCNPKFGLSSSVFLSGGDSSDLLSISVNNKGQKRVGELEYQINQLNVELESAKVNNEHLEQTIYTLQKKIGLCNKEITQLSNDLIAVQKERDAATETCVRNNEMLKEMEKKNQQLESKLIKSEENKENTNTVCNSSEKNIMDHLHQSTTSSSAGKMDKAAATVIRHLLTENKLINSRLRKLKDELRVIYEQCSSCPSCVKEKKLKKSSAVLSLQRQQKLTTASTSEDDKNEMNGNTHYEKEVNDGNFLLKIIKEQEKQIKHLKAENKKKTYNLQELVNKELWDKNREIEKLNKICDKRKHELDVIKKHFPADGRNALTLPNNVDLKEIQSNCVRCNNNGEKEKICVMLTNRLEEMACFLEKLLANDFDSVSVRKRELLKQAIERSREISKSFSIAFVDFDNSSTVATKFESTADLSAPILPDCSEINLSFSGEDDDYEVQRTQPPSTDDNQNVNSTEESDYYVAKRPVRIINDLNASSELVFSSRGVLQLEGANVNNNIKSINDELKAGDKKYEKRTLQNKLLSNSVTASSAIVSIDEAPKVRDFDSESETWSEPDRNVSAARIGLPNSCSKLQLRRMRSDKQFNTDSDISDKIGNNDIILLKEKAEFELAEKIKTIVELEKLLRESNYESKQFELEIGVLRNSLKACQEKAQLEIIEKTNTIVELQELLRLSDEKSRNFEQEITTLKETLNTLEERCEKETLEKTAIITDLRQCLKQSDEKIKNLEEESEHLRNTLKTCEDKARIEIEEKSKLIDDLKQLLSLSDEKIKRFENEISCMMKTLQKCEEEKRDFQNKIDKHMVDYETLKKEHEQKMQHLLAEIVAYRKEEEANLVSHRQLVDQVEDIRQKKELLAKYAQEWKEKYDEMKKQKENVEKKLQSTESQQKDLEAIQEVHLNKVAEMDKEYKLMKFSMERDWFLREADLRYQLDVATLTTSHVISEWTRLANEKLRLQRELVCRDKPYYIHHLENVKSQLERRVRELEMANKELESRLQLLRTTKILPSDLEITSEDSSRATSPLKMTPFEFPTNEQQQQMDNFVTCKNNKIAIKEKYTSSLPTSPNHCETVSSLLTGSVPSSPLSAKQTFHDNNNWRLITEMLSPDVIYVNGFSDSSAENQRRTPLKENCAENDASSPDLGIDSDCGRNSSFDFNIARNGNKIRNEINLLEDENKTLKEELSQTKKELEETLAKLTVLNRNKKRMEKAIFKQIYETKHILKQARVNLEDANVNSVSGDGVMS